MSALSIQVPFPVFQDRDGQPLDNGYIWVGVANLNPQTNPVVAYYDEALTIVAAQPLRTLNGYISRAGTPAQIYVNGVDFSILVQDSKGSMVYNFPDGTGISPNASGVSFTGFKGQVGFVQDLADDDGSDWVGFKQAGTGSIAISAQDKMRQTVSVKDFGAVGDWNGTSASPGTGTDDTIAIQNAINYCVTNGVGLFFPPGRYRTTSPLIINRSFNTADPTEGGMYGISLFGADPASCQIASDHNGICISFIGGAGAGWHTYFAMTGLGLLKANYTRSVGSVGLQMDQSVYFAIQQFDVSFFEYGIYGIDCLSGSFANGSIRLNNYGFKFLKGTRSYPNNISFRGVITLNNQIYGGYLVKPSVFNYIGGSIESNGYTGILADPNSWGLYVDNPGIEGSVGINMQGVYIENNNGKADVYIVAVGATNATTSINTFSGCSFLRFSSTRYVTNCILIDGAPTNQSRVSVSGCGFKDYTPYVSDASRLWIAAGNVQVLDGGGNLFCDDVGGYVGVSRSVFAPLGINHQLPFASLPDTTVNRNGIQYCSDGGGGTTRPSLSVSDGTQWWQIVLGQFAGSVQSGGTANTLPRGWSVSKTGTGVYRVTHSLTITATQYAVIATPNGAAGTGYCSGVAKTTTYFDIYFANTSGSAADMAFDFTFSVI